MNNEIKSAKPGQTIVIELKAALNQDWNKIDKGWVEITNTEALKNKLELIETGNNTGIFIAKFTIPQVVRHKAIKVSYGYLGLGKTAIINIQ